MLTLDTDITQINRVGAATAKRILDLRFSPLLRQLADTEDKRF